MYNNYKEISPSIVYFMKRTTVVYQARYMAANEAAIELIIKIVRLTKINKFSYLDLLGDGMWEYLLYMSER